MRAAATRAHHDADRRRAVEEVIFGSGNVLSALGRNTVHISMSAISVAVSERLAEAHAKAARTYGAAPVFGRPDAAKLFIIATGPRRRSCAANRYSMRSARRPSRSATSRNRQTS
jgi:3-hydroxyisobutyrate dehydrogenase-like beta-hydroxyacid dehydrogenase